MKNLTLLTSSYESQSSGLGSSSSNSIASVLRDDKCLCTAVVYQDGRVFFTTIDGQSLSFEIRDDADEEEEEDAGDDGSPAEPRTPDSDFFLASRIDPMVSKASSAEPLLVFLAASRSGGGIYLVSIFRPSSSSSSSSLTPRCSLLGRVDCGLVSGALSPSKELVVFHTADDKLLALTVPSTADYCLPEEGGDEEAALGSDVVFEVETPAHLPGSPSVISFNSSSSSFLHSQVDCAVSSPSGSSPSAVVRIYDAVEGSVLALLRNDDGSPITSLSPSSATWCKSSDFGDRDAECCGVIAASRAKGGRGGAFEVVLFEKNGLRHREFAMKEEATNLTFNKRGDLLAAVTDKGRTLKIYNRGNYHWYQKYEFQASPLAGSDGIFDEYTFVSFDEADSRPHRLLVGTRSGVWSCHDFVWDPSTLPCTGSSDASCPAAVIDGPDLNITPLGIMMLPPPMAAATLPTGGGGILAVAVAKLVPENPEHPTVRGAALTTGHPYALTIFGEESSLAPSGAAAVSPSLTKPAPTRFFPPVILGKVSLSSDTGFFRDLHLRQLVIVPPRASSLSPLVADQSSKLTFSVLSLASRSNDSDDSVVEFRLAFDGASGTFSLASDPVFTPSAGRLIRIVGCPPSSSASDDVAALVESASGELFLYGRGVVRPHLISLPISLLEPCPWIAPLLLSSSSSHHSPSAEVEASSSDIGPIVGLSARGRLYVGEHLVCQSTSSFCVSEDHGFLVYVTVGSRAQLRFQPLSVLKDWDPSEGGEEAGFREEGYEPREVEAGSKLVAVIPGKPSAVLQMPRGNLEGVAPRALTLELCRKLLDRGKFGEAFEVMRRHRVDLNLMIDHNPKVFLAGSKDFLDQITCVDHLNLFVSQLQDADFIKDKYVPPINVAFSEALPTRDLPSADFFEKKVNIVCKELRSRMIENGSEYLFLPILSTFAKEKPPQLESALDLIVQKTAARGGKMSDAFAQDSIKYLAFLADYDILFDCGLGMYNWELAKAIARNSQKDPKVYLPLLDKYSKMDKNMARYEVDISLKRYASAVVHLAKAGEVQLALQLIEGHQLERLGLEIFAEAEPRKSVMSCLARRFIKEGKSKAAVSLFLACNDVHAAIEAAKICGDWRAIFTAFDGDGVDETDFQAHTLESLAEEVVDILTTSVGPTHRADKLAAGNILVDYCENKEGAIAVLIEGQWFLEALRIAAMIKPTERRRSTTAMIHDAVVSYANACITDIEERSEKFNDTLPRYLEVKEIRAQVKIKEDEHLEEFGTALNDGTNSMFSAATDFSNASMLSASSVGSTKSYSSGYSGTKSNFTVTSTQHKEPRKKLGSKAETKDLKRMKGYENRMKKREEKKMKPGSQEELNYLHGVLKEVGVGSEEIDKAAETITVLIRIGETEGLGKALHDSISGLVETLAAANVPDVTINRFPEDIGVIFSYFEK